VTPPVSKEASHPLSPAATVVVLRDRPDGIEVLMVRRHEGTPFMGGAHVFPGGRVDDGDRAVAGDHWCDGVSHAITQLRDLAEVDALAFHVAAIRELFEEAGVLLARAVTGDFLSLADADAHLRFKRYRTDVHSGASSLRDLVEQEGLRLALDALVTFAHWVTPPVDTRRFDTRFFVARMPPQQIPAHDETETTQSAWIRPSDAIARCVRNEIVLPPPTWTTLRELEPFSSVDEAIGWARRRRVMRRLPAFLQQDGRKMLLLPGDPLNPEPPVEERPHETRFVLVEGRWRAVQAR
jgi:8-oxo-dGTP pyrophosphatase MutT (NUDIX family)